MKYLFILGFLLLLAAGGWYGWNHLHPKAPVAQWRTSRIERGTVIQEVRATGAIQPVKNILVGTQVNGPVKRLYADFNDEVKAGQMIAQIDPVVYQANVARDEATLASAKANVESSQSNVEQIEAKLTLAEKELRRMKQLVSVNMVSQSDYDTALSNRDALTAQLKITRASVNQTQAAVMQAGAALQLSRANLGYTTICSPVDGVVIQRNVDEGQTVVSSMNAQTIFTIATDLSTIQIQADIPEADVGGIRPGQSVTFTVDAYNPMSFTGEVVQVRMAATTVQNVVTFPVIIQAKNPLKKLFPGMTANLAIETGRIGDALKIPAAALRFTPPDRSAETFADKKKPDAQPGIARIWLVSEDNTPHRVQVRQLLSDGTWIAVEADEPIEGRNVITGINTVAEVATTENPFAPKMPPGGGRMPHRMR